MAFVQTIQSWWVKSSPFRHAVFAFLAVNLALPLAQISDWAASKGTTPLPNWHSVLLDVFYASLTALIAAILRFFQRYNPK